MKKELNCHPIPSIYGSAEVGVKGQVVIPVKLRKEFGIKPGDNLFFLSQTSQGAIIILKMETVLALSKKITAIGKGLEKLKAKMK
ncbi:MAG: AbrB/MazE/SpoVT family DNA-binding domain-containing protein [Candidatus Buchananbacteria bacterium]